VLEEVEDEENNQEEYEYEPYSKQNEEELKKVE